MPTYEYECEKCKKTFEAFQSMSADPLTSCDDEECGGKVHRLISSGAGFLFKGSGFYITDYRSDNYKKAAKSDTAPSSSDSSSKKSGDSKAAPKSKTPDKTSSKAK